MTHLILRSVRLCHGYLVFGHLLISIETVQWSSYTWHLSLCTIRWPWRLTFNCAGSHYVALCVCNTEVWRRSFVRSPVIAHLVPRLTFCISIYLQLITLHTFFAVWWNFQSLNISSFTADGTLTVRIIWLCDRDLSLRPKTRPRVTRRSRPNMAIFGLIGFSVWARCRHRTAPSLSKEGRGV